MRIRRWQRWLRWSFILVSTWVVILLLRNVLIAVGSLSGFESARNDKLSFDHWGVGPEDIEWLPNLIKQRTGEIPVVVVEEHYEVIKYWFQASDHGALPMSRNTLIHIDGHVDGAVPYDTASLPWFRYPVTRKQIYNMMQRNDMFIVIAALTGLIDHVVWVWPLWDLGNHEEADTHVVIKIEMGYTRVKVETELGTHQMDLCACWRVLEEYERLDGYDPGDASWECHRQNFYEVDAENGPTIARAACQIQAHGVLEVMSEATALVELPKLKASRGILLDIDEDFFGCWSDMIPLQSVGVSYKQVKLLSDLVSDLLCAETAMEERDADMFYTALISLVVRLKSRGCEVRDQQSALNTGKCLTNLEISNYIIEQIPFMLDFLEDAKHDNIHCHPDPKLRGLFLQSLLQYLQNFTIKQLKLLLDLGICFKTSPSSSYFETDGSLHVCMGDNMPNRTQVTFYLPTKEDVALRTVSLRKILGSVSQKPDLITVCRSVRDGYTPKQLFPVIESNILQSLGAVYRAAHLDKVHYDTNLLGGKPGWSSHPQTWSRELMEYLSSDL